MGELAGLLMFLWGLLLFIMFCVLVSRAKWNRHAYNELRVMRELMEMYARRDFPLVMKIRDEGEE